MRACLVMVSLAFACGGGPRPVARVSEFDFTLMGRYHVDHLRHGGGTYELLDGADRTKVVATVTGATDEALFTPGEGGGNNLLALRTTTGWQLVVYRDDPATHHTTLVAMPPRLRDVKQLAAAQDKIVWAVDAGSEPGLLLPMDRDGHLAWFPEGVIGVKPVIAGMQLIGEWQGWLVRWRSPAPGWSIAMKEDLTDLAPTGPTWVDVRVTEPPGLQVVEGVRPDGTCDDIPIVRFPDKPTQPRSGPTCAIARKLTFEQAEREIAEGHAELARLEARHAEQAREAAAAEAAADQHDLEAAQQYASLIGTSHSMPAAACTLATSMSFQAHLRVIEGRTFGHDLVAGERACLSNRALSVSDQSAIRAMDSRAYRLQHPDPGFADAPAPPSAGPRASGRDAISDESRATEARTKAMRDYTYGRGGICPYERSLCN